MCTPDRPAQVSPLPCCSLIKHNVNGNAAAGTDAAATACIANDGAAATVNTGTQLLLLVLMLLVVDKPASVPVRMVFHVHP